VVGVELDNWRNLTVLAEGEGKEEQEHKTGFGLWAGVLISHEGKGKKKSFEGSQGRRNRRRRNRSES